MTIRTRKPGKLMQNMAKAEEVKDRQIFPILLFVFLPFLSM